MCVCVFLHGRGVGAGQPQVHRQLPRPLLQLRSHWTVALSVRLVLAPHWSVGRAHKVDGHDDLGALHLPTAALSFLLLILLLFLFFLLIPLLLPPLIFFSFFPLLLLLLFDLLPEMSGFTLNDWLEGLTSPLTGGGHLGERGEIG